MQRFAIKIDKSVKARLKNLCRLCGIDNPNQIEILNAAEWIDLTIDGEVSLSRKIADCVDIQVTKNDKMPQRICALCVDKINDFYEFREMCQATNIQTRKLLSLPDPAKAKPTKKVTIKTDEDDDVESIFGIVGTDVKSKAEPEVKQKSVQKSIKKSKKGATSTASITSENRFKGMTKREIEITLELERIKKEDEQEKNFNEIRTKNGKKKKRTTNPSDTLLLAPKQPNQRERKRDIEQKKIEKKRKSELKAKPPAKKKIKKEPGVSCFVCDERFEKNSFRDAHMVANHRPLQAEYGCSSCIEQFASIEEHTSHHEWHSLFNVPHKCPMCGAIFEKLITFQRHVSACVHQTYTLMTTFSKSIFCELCNLEFETQNLYDWHNCFIGQNSPCPKCQRVFTKKTVLMKHMFKCTGPGSVVEMPKKIATTTGKLAKRKQAGTTTSEIIPQNSFKFEPETIIEPADEAYDELDNSYMDTHFGDSDNEFDANDSIMTPIEPIVEPSPQTSVSNVNTPIYSKARKSTTCTSLNVDTNIRSNLNQPLLECRVKLEPIDISNYAIPSTSTNAESSEDRPLTVPPLVISRPTVPPLTIRIKKEVIQPGYGDDFNPDVARNIKQERVDETYELAGTSRDEYSISHKKSKHRQKEKKLYKKPALLAIKIKQERMEREDNDDNNENYYPDYSMSSPDFRGTMVNSSFNSNSLPIITQIHSALEPSAISPLMNVQSSEHQNSLPFVPIRIKSEFQKPLTPPWSLTPAEEVNEQLSRNSNNTTTENSSLSQRQILNENNECDINLSSCNALNQQSGTSLNQQSGNGSATNQETSKSNSVNDFSEISPNEPSANPVNTEQELKRTERVSSSYDILCERHPQSINEKDSNPFQDGVDNHNEIIQDERSSENLSKQQDLTIDEDPNRMQMENEVLPSQNEVSTINNEMHEEQIDNRIVAEIKMHEENNVSIEKNVNDGNNQNTHFASQVSSEPIENVLDSEANLLKPLCDDLDSEVTNEIMSPIDFIEPNTNDDSLNFIDQLVHEVADTMVSQVGDVVESNDNIPFETANDHIENAQLECNVGCSEENHENKANIINESNLEPIDKTKVNDTVLTLFDIDSKINGNTNPPIQTNSTPSANELIQLPVNTHVLNEPDLSKFCSN